MNIYKNYQEQKECAVQSPGSASVKDRMAFKMPVTNSKSERNKSTHARLLCPFKIRRSVIRPIKAKLTSNTQNASVQSIGKCPCSAYCRREQNEITRVR